MEIKAPILEFDPEKIAILNPRPVKTSEPAPKRAVLCFFQEVLNHLVSEGRIYPIGYLGSEMGKNPLYVMEHEGQKILVAHPGVGASLAAGFLEEMIALGTHSFIACGGCGVLDKSIAVGHPVVVTSAIRDEGTSYHYLPAARESVASPAAVQALEKTLNDRKIDYLTGKSWTTDAIYRETTAKRDLRMAEGCIVVEMEASAFFAVAEFRGVTFGQVIYGGDLVVPEGWDYRGWNDRQDDRSLMFWISVEACLRLPE